MTGEQLKLTGRDALAVVEDLHVIEGEIATDEPTLVPVVASDDRFIDALTDRNLFG